MQKNVHLFHVLFFWEYSIFWFCIFQSVCAMLKNIIHAGQFLYYAVLTTPAFTGMLPAWGYFL